VLVGDDFKVGSNISNFPADHQLVQQNIQLLPGALQLGLYLLMREPGLTADDVHNAFTDINLNGLLGVRLWFVPVVAGLNLLFLLFPHLGVELALQFECDRVGEMLGEFDGGCWTDGEEVERVGGVGRQLED
jgi:hypothetical protein